MLLAIDVGNSSVTVGRFEGRRLLAVRSVDCEEVGSADLTQAFGVEQTPLGAGDSVALASVNPSAADVVLAWARSQCAAEPLVAGESLPVGIPDAVADRRRIGVDRLLNGLAAYHRTQSACLVVDLGSALTIDAVSAEGVFLGGIIAPGLSMAARALAAGTAFLPQVKLTFPETVVGRDTTEAIRSGILWGYVDMVTGLLARLKGEVDEAARVFLTGGGAQLLAPHLPGVDEVVAYLTLEGLCLAVPGYSTQGN